jgi:hypothetical protein
MKSNRKPFLIIRRSDNLGGIHKLEFFNPSEKIYVVHRHSLVTEKLIANILGFKRMFYGKYYCMQELTIFESELQHLSDTFKK